MRAPSPFALLHTRVPRREMVSKEVFERQFWHCYDRFKATATADVGVPGYFRFITLLGTTPRARPTLKRARRTRFS